jgi:hypothetical protein
MPRGNPKYDKELKDTLEWKCLYSRYNATRTSIYRDVFPTFQQFYDWSMANGFVCGAKLGRIDTSKPFIQDNLMWTMPEGKQAKQFRIEVQESIKRWNDTVNRIRANYGMKPLRTERRSVSDETVL